MRPHRELLLPLLESESFLALYPAWRLPRLLRMPNIVSGESPMRARHFTCSVQSMLCSGLITTKLRQLKKQLSTLS